MVLYVAHIESCGIVNRRIVLEAVSCPLHVQRTVHLHVPYIINAKKGLDTPCTGGQWGTLPMRVFSSLDQPWSTNVQHLGQKRVCTHKASASATRVGHPTCGAYFGFGEFLSTLQNEACALARAKSTRSRASLVMMFGWQLTGCRCISFWGSCLERACGIGRWGLDLLKCQIVFLPAIKTFSDHYLR